MGNHLFWSHQVNTMDKLLFFDIDGTLTYPRSEPSPATVDAIRSARSNGHKVFLSTGRTPDSVPDAVMKIGFDGGIFSAGGCVMYGDTVLSHHFMPDLLVQKILILLRDISIFFKLETADGRFRSENGRAILSQVNMAGASSEMQRFTEELLCDPRLRPLSQYSGQPVYKISFFSIDRTMADHLSAALEGSAKVVRFDNLVPDFPLTAGEISDFSVSKGSALQEICRHLGKTAADCVAFGDSMNDAEILKAAGLGIAMGNAETRVKELADMVCDRCENDGLAKAMLDLDLAVPPQIG